MSKSKGNVINPDDIVAAYGADTMRLYEMFMGPFEQAIAWDSKGVMGARRFLERAWELYQKSKCGKSNVKFHPTPFGQKVWGKNPKSKIQNIRLKKLLHKTIKKVSEDIERMKFNTAVSSLMEFSNEWQKGPQGLGRRGVEDFLKLLAPFAPHLAEELYQKSKCQNPNVKFHPTPFGQKVWGKNPKSKIQISKSSKFNSIFEEKWPRYDPKLIEEEKITLIVQVNGKVRDKIEVEKGISGERVKEIVLGSPKIKKWLEERQIKKTVFLPNKLINFVV